MLFKKILRNINLLNIVLTVTVVLFGSYWLSPLLAAKIKYALPAAGKPIEVKGEEKTSQPQAPSVTEYTIISEENLFHPERRIPPEKKAEEAPLPKPDFVLYGTLMADDIKLAYLEDLKAPRSTAGRGKRQVAMKKGDALSGFTLKEIETDKVVMVRGGEKMIVSINDPSHPKTREGQPAVAQASQPAPANMPGHAPSAFQPRPAATTEAPAKRQQPATKPAVPAGQSAVTSRSAPGDVSYSGQKLLDLFRRGRN
jgi:type II secretory pathway component PulC